MDEPFNGSDARTKFEIIAFLREHLAEKPVVLVTHNQDALDLVERVYALVNGVLGPVEEPPAV